MNNGRSNENLREELEGRQMALMHLNMIGGRANYKNFHNTQIAALQRELNRRAKARAQARWKKVRGHVGARGIVGYLQRLSMMPPTRGGAGYMRLMRQTGIGRPSTRNVGTSTSPRRSPRRRSPSRSRSPRRRTPNKRSPGRSPRR